jgi:hypothetical protein
MPWAEAHAPLRSSRAIMQPLLPNRSDVANPAMALWSAIEGQGAGSQPPQSSESKFLPDTATGG